MEVIIEASQVPDQQQSVAQIYKLINHLQIGLIKVVVYAKEKGTNSLVWYQDFEPAKVDTPLSESIDFLHESRNEGKLEVEDRRNQVKA